jgi:hypothetical protein
MHRNTVSISGPGKLTNQIARKQGCVASAVSKYLYEFGFPPRATGLPHQRKGQIPYGSRMVKGRLVEHKGEQVVIAQLIELRKQGESFGELVAWLDVNQIRTKSKYAKRDRPLSTRFCRGIVNSQMMSRGVGMVLT